MSLDSEPSNAGEDAAKRQGAQGNNPRGIVALDSEPSKAGKAATRRARVAPKPVIQPSEGR
jgi:hypothetical protein